ncbi:hypothetical protein [Nocardia salmonicida]|uniref:hypothetical protein n=1 Tax=Nocardia salmonicida TaxID=53431 RepID=UPI000B119205
MTRSDTRPILPSPKTVLEALATPHAVLPHRHPELIIALQQLHAQHRAYRAAATDLATEGLPPAVLTVAAATVTAVASDVEHTIFQIDCEIARRIESGSVAVGSSAPHHTESVGAVLSRVVLLWIEIDTHRDGTTELPEALELFQLLGAYDALREEVATGARRLPTPRRPLS